jgi:hypothetical protein
LGQLALNEFHDPTLARGHFEYAFELGHRAISQPFYGSLPPERPANRPFYDAIRGLLECLEALGRRHDAQRLRNLRDRLAGGGS